jgi:hypothetical protein
MSRDGERAPITRQQSEWFEIDGDGWLALPPGSGEVAAFGRRVHDGLLRAIRARERGLLHLSISWAPHSEMQARRGRLRYPSWDEIADARDQLLPPDVEFVMLLPKRGEYVAVHATTFHLHEHRP